jgi:hypothetical protein
MNDQLRADVAEVIKLAEKVEDSSMSESRALSALALKKLAGIVAQLIVDEDLGDVESEKVKPVKTGQVKGKDKPVSAPAAEATATVEPNEE